jgi:hypothetical protein
MRDSDEGFPDDVPVADAVEQQRPTADLPPNEDLEAGVPLETTASGWQEQRETVLIDPELEGPGQIRMTANQTLAAIVRGYSVIPPPREARWASPRLRR